MSMKQMRLFLATVLAAAVGLGATGRAADEYAVDPAHAAATFKISHLGLSWTYGRFKDVSGSFAIANYVSLATWLVLPAAPPWYIRAHGCAIDLSVTPSAAGLLRVDHYLGMHYFEAFYGRAASVFGAMPSMHCAYPMIGLLTAWRAASPRTKPLHVTYTLLMFVASVYLDHHWVFDGLAGWTIAVLSVYVASP